MGENRDKAFKDKNVDEMYKKIMSGEITLNEKNFEDSFKNINQYQQIVDRGIRDPQTIFETYYDKLVSKRDNY